jgi:hypothetical protein
MFDLERRSEWGDRQRRRRRHGQHVIFVERRFGVRVGRR